jgi:hypothetical protein
MKLALIGAPNTFSVMDRFHLGYHLVLAQECVRDKTYLNYYKFLHRDGHFIILDNGAAEMGKSMDFGEVLDVAADLQPDEIVMPDVLGDYGDTLRQTATACAAVPENKRLMVPQGENWIEWGKCLTEMLHLGCVTIGIAKRYEGLAGGRIRALEKFIHTEAQVNVHMLGCYQDPIREIQHIVGIYPWVRGIDTAAPFAHAQVPMNMNGLVGHVPYEWGKPFNQKQADINVTYTLQVCTR